MKYYAKLNRKLSEDHQNLNTHFHLYFTKLTFLLNQNKLFHRFPHVKVLRKYKTLLAGNEIINYDEWIIQANTIKSLSSRSSDFSKLIIDLYL